MTEKTTGKPKARSTAKQAVAARKSGPQPAPGKAGAGGERPDGPTAISADERRKLIAEAAYLRAERRGFRGGSPEQDWLDAEAEVDRALAGED